MVSIAALWLPILVSAVLVFLVSWIINAFLPYHRSDYGRLTGEDEVLAAMRQAGVTPGDYVFPHARTMAEMREPAYVERRATGPVGVLTVMPSGQPRMGAMLAQWFVYTIVISTIAAYVASRAVGPGADYGAAFRFAGTTAFAAYGLALWPLSIWYGRSWSTTAKGNFDALVYALITGGVFGWLWP